MTLSYLVSTAGHAQYQNEQHPHNVESVLQLIVDGARELQDEKVVGFTRPIDGSWRCDRYSFPELLGLAAAREQALVQAGIASDRNGGGIVSVVCPTGLDFLVTWIALMRMGRGMVFVAPQCSPSAIAHLVRSSSSTHLVYHPKYRDLATSAHAILASTPLVGLPALSEDVPSSTGDLDSIPLPLSSSVSHVFHTSGTSGNPKPIPHTHLDSVAPLPRRALPSYISEYACGSGMAPFESAAFTTTPLFHGGVSDLLRAWMARSMIYFYPTNEVAITADNVVKAVEACSAVNLPPLSRTLSNAEDEERRFRFTVTAFLSVPYILTILAENSDGPGLQALKRMELVSTGGAPLDTAVGDGMVKRGVRLVSRLGSSECGFLLSSHRDYASELDWEWLRNDSQYATALSFEPVASEPGKYEMIVTSAWRSKTKSNRDDDSYATGDLYAPHPEKAGVWKYVGRGDDVIVLSNGEKASPGPIETVLRSSPLLSDVLVVGSDRSQIGALLFPRSFPPAPSLITDLSDLIAKANSASPSFAQLSPEMLHIVSNRDKELPKSSKGTIQRGVAYESFNAEIAILYGGPGSAETGPSAGAETAPKRSVKEVEDVVREIIEQVAASRIKVAPLGMETDLFSWGVDSLMATRIRTAMLKSLNIGGKKLATNVVFEQPSIKRLAQHVHDLQEGVTPSADAATDTHQLMRDLAEKYSSIDFPSQPYEKQQADAGLTILLTGATGSLGTFLLSELHYGGIAKNAKVICIVRADDHTNARKRVAAAMDQRDLPWDMSRTEIFAANLALPDLGLSGDELGSLVKSVDVIIHAAWPVHFTSNLISFEDNIKGTHNLLNIAARTSSARLFFCSSLASVLNSTASHIAEEPTDDPSTASPIGYSQSKWVTEKVCLAAAGQMPGRVKILRVGQLCGDTAKGRWNEKEGWPLMIRTAEVVGCLPELDEKPTWLPVDTAAKAIIDVISTDLPRDQAMYHISHPQPLVWSNVLDGLQAAGLRFDRVQPPVWLERMWQSEEDLAKNPSRGMLDMWQRAYGATPITRAEDPTIDTAKACGVSNSLRTVLPVGGNIIRLMVAQWRKSGFVGPE